VSGSGVELKMPQLKCRQFTERIPDGIVYFQILELDSQLYIWMSAQGPKMDNLSVAMPQKFDSVPAVSTILGAAQGAGNDIEPLAQRLVMATGESVFLSSSIPPHSSLMQAVAEKRLIKEIKAMQQERSGNPKAE